MSSQFMISTLNTCTPLNMNQPNPTSLQSFEILHSLLWGKGAVQRAVIYNESEIEIPSYDTDNVSSSAQPSLISMQRMKCLDLRRINSPISAYLPCGLQAIVIRPAYVEFFDFLKNPPEAETRLLKNGCILLGHPGIGKTTFLSYVLVERLLHEKSTAYQTSANTVFLFTRTGVEIINTRTLQAQPEYKDILNDNTIWILCDTPPTAIMDATQWWCLQAPSPVEQNYKTWLKKKNPDIFYMEPWSWSEIVVARELCVDRGTERALVDFHIIYTLYGPAARTVLSTLLPPVRGNEAERQLFNELQCRYNHALENKVTKVIKELDIDFLDDQGKSIDSHSLTLMVPFLPFESRHKTFKRGYETRPISKHIIGLLLRAAIAKDAQKAKDFSQQLIQRYPLFGTTGGMVFENLVHRLLSAGPVIRLHNLPIPNQKGSSSTPADITIAFNKLSVTENLLYDLSNLAEFLRLSPDSRDVKPQVLNRYLRPRIGNLAAVDSIALISGRNIAWRILPSDYNPCLPTLLLFQSTVLIEHPISLGGLHDILNAVPANAKKNPLILVWVVREERLRIRKQARVRGFLFDTQKFKDTAGKESISLLQVVTTFSQERLWEFKDWDSAGDLLDSPEHSYEQSAYIGKQIHQSKEHLRNGIARLLNT